MEDANKVLDWFDPDLFYADYFKQMQALNCPMSAWSIPPGGSGITVVTVGPRTGVLQEVQVFDQKYSPAVPVFTMRLETADELVYRINEQRTERWICEMLFLATLKIKNWECAALEQIRSLASNLAEAHRRNPQRLSQQDKAVAEAEKVAEMTGRYVNRDGERVYSKTFIDDYVELYFKHGGF